MERPQLPMPVIKVLDARVESTISLYCKADNSFTFQHTFSIGPAAIEKWHFLFNNYQKFPIWSENSQKLVILVYLNAHSFPVLKCKR